MWMGQLTGEAVTSRSSNALSQFSMRLLPKKALCRLVHGTRNNQSVGKRSAMILIARMGDPLPSRVPILFAFDQGIVDLSGGPMIQKIA